MRSSVQSRTVPGADTVRAPVNAGCYCYCWVVAPRGACQVHRPVLGGGSTSLAFQGGHHTCLKLRESAHLSLGARALHPRRGRDVGLRMFP